MGDPGYMRAFVFSLSFSSRAGKRRIIDVYIATCAICTCDEDATFMMWYASVITFFLILCDASKQDTFFIRLKDYIYVDERFE